MNKDRVSERLFKKLQALLKEERLEQSTQIERYEAALQAAYDACESWLRNLTWATMCEPALVERDSVGIHIETLQSNPGRSLNDTRELHHLQRRYQIYTLFLGVTRTTAREAQIAAEDRQKEKTRRQQTEPAAVVAKRYRTPRRGYVSRRGR